MRVLLVTSWNTPHGCGIEAHSRYLIDAVSQADPTITFVPSEEALDPKWAMNVVKVYDVVHLNYQAALHSRWTPQAITDLKEQFPQVKVLVTYHDTGVPNSDQCKGVIAASDAAVVHEAFDDLPKEKTHYWRQGVVEPNGELGRRSWFWSARPTVGTVGHDFGWKNIDKLCELAKEVGWGVVFCTPQELSDERLAQLKALNPWVRVHSGLNVHTTIATLHECHVTAFLYVTHNTGTSGAIRLGIAARKPIIALRTCRQFRDLAEDLDNPLGRRVINWCDTMEDVRFKLRSLTLGSFDAGICALAEQESWVHLAKKYANLYRQLAG